MAITAFNPVITLQAGTQPSEVGEPARAGEGALLLPSLPASSLLSSHLQESLEKCLQEEMQRNKETLESAVKVGMSVQAVRICPTIMLVGVLSQWNYIPSH